MTNQTTTPAGGVGRLLRREHARALELAENLLEEAASGAACRRHAARLRWLAADLEQATALPGLETAAQYLERAREARSAAERLDQLGQVLAHVERAG